MKNKKLLIGSMVALMASSALMVPLAVYAGNPPSGNVIPNFSGLNIMDGGTATSSIDKQVGLKTLNGIFNGYITATRSITTNDSLSANNVFGKFIRSSSSVQADMNLMAKKDIQADGNITSGGIVSAPSIIGNTIISGKDLWMTGFIKNASIEIGQDGNITKTTNPLKIIANALLFSQDGTNNLLQIDPTTGFLINNVQSAKIIAGNMGLSMKNNQINLNTPGDIYLTPSGSTILNNVTVKSDGTITNKNATIAPDGTITNAAFKIAANGIISSLVPYKGVNVTNDDSYSSALNVNNKDGGGLNVNAFNFGLQVSNKNANNNTAYFKNEGDGTSVMIGGGNTALWAFGNTKINGKLDADELNISKNATINGGLTVGAVTSTGKLTAAGGIGTFADYPLKSSSSAASSFCPADYKLISCGISGTGGGDYINELKKTTITIKDSTNKTIEKQGCYAYVMTYNAVTKNISPSLGGWSVSANCWNPGA